MRPTGAVFLILVIIEVVLLGGPRKREVSPTAELPGISLGPAGLRGELQVRVWSRNWFCNTLISLVPVIGLGQEEELGTGNPHPW